MGIPLSLPATVQLSLFVLWLSKNSHDQSVGTWDWSLRILGHLMDCASDPVILVMFV